MSNPKIGPRFPTSKTETHPHSSFGDTVKKLDKNVERAGIGATLASSGLSGLAGAARAQVEAVKNLSPAERAAMGNKALRLMRLEADVYEGVARSSNKLGRGLGVAGALITGVEQGVNSHCTTLGGKIANGVASSGYTTAALVANPGVAVVDVLTGGQVSATTKATASSVVAATEALATGNTAGAQKVHEQNRSGDNGVPAAIGAWAGENIAKGALGSADETARWNADNASGKNGAVNQALSNLGNFIGGLLFD
ncbi:MAG: hypothetical protein HY791_18295 [Deltaproteobacteria bacterium]|nr:hypothetical protein [Deltaproteobacteria bacterium]